MPGDLVKVKRKVAYVEGQPFPCPTINDNLRLIYYIDGILFWWRGKTFNTDGTRMPEVNCVIANKLVRCAQRYGLPLRFIKILWG